MGQRNLWEKLQGEKDIEATIQRLDRLTLDEGRATPAQTLGVVYGLVQHRKAIMDGEYSIRSVLPFRFIPQFLRRTDFFPSPPFSIIFHLTLTSNLVSQNTSTPWICFLRLFQMLRYSRLRIAGSTARIWCSCMKADALTR